MSAMTAPCTTCSRCMHSRLPTDFRNSPTSTTRSSKAWAIAHDAFSSPDTSGLFAASTPVHSSVPSSDSGISGRDTFSLLWGESIRHSAQLVTDLPSIRHLVRRLAQGTQAFRHVSLGHTQASPWVRHQSHLLSEPSDGPLSGSCPSVSFRISDYFRVVLTFLFDGPACGPSRL